MITKIGEQVKEGSVISDKLKRMADFVAGKLPPNGVQGPMYSDQPFYSQLQKTLGTAAVGIPMYIGYKSGTKLYDKLHKMYSGHKAVKELKNDPETKDIPEADLKKHVGILKTIAPNLLTNKDIAANIVNKMHTLGYDLSTLRELSNIDKTVGESNALKDKKVPGLG